jgi:signal transduction histidine kinase
MGEAMRDDTAQDRKIEAPQAVAGLLRLRYGLASRLVLLVVCFVMLAEIAVYVPSVANFRNNWLRDRLSSANTAALVFEAAPAEMIPDELAAEILKSVGARTIVMKIKDSRRLLAVSTMPEHVDESFDLRTWTPWESIAAAFRALAAGDGRVLKVTGDGPMGAEFVELTLDEAPLLRAMHRYSVNILLLSLVISLIVAGLAVLALHLMVLRPVRRLTSSIMDFGAAPEDVSRVIEPSGRTHEIGLAEQALATMQQALSRELNEKKNLAALGLAVAKINHDLRNMLASAQLLSDRLAELPDPLSRRLAPRLVATLDRAIAFCQSTLTYGRAVERPAKIGRVALRPLVAEVAATVAPAGLSSVEIAVEIPDDVELRADTEQLFRVFLNLIRNAVDALESAGPQPGRSALVRIRATRDNGRVIVDVEDSGPGVPEARRARLFEAFQGSARPGGTGLGLAIAADLVRAQGGEIRLVDGGEDGLGGAVFRIHLPSARLRKRGRAA